MSTIRRNLFIRTVAAVTGDVTIGYTVAAACIWVIQSAALGAFLSFLLWLAAIFVALALSQFALHPLLDFALSDQKLDLAVSASVDAVRVGSDSVKRIWTQAQQRLADFRPLAAHG